MVVPFWLRYPYWNSGKFLFLIWFLIGKRVFNWSDYPIPAYICLFSWTVNRRLDEWVKLDQLDLDSVEADVEEKVEDKVTSLCHLCLFSWTVQRRLDEWVKLDEVDSTYSRFTYMYFSSELSAIHSFSVVPIVSSNKYVFFLF